MVSDCARLPAVCLLVSFFQRLKGVEVNIGEGENQQGRFILHTEPNAGTSDQLRPFASVVL